MTVTTATDPSEVLNGTVSEATVMRSAAGYYVGTFRMDDGMWVPCERFSDYMPKQEQAQEWLASAKRTGGL